MKKSRQRDLILKTLQENVVHPTAEYIYELVKKEQPSISLATVYRNLNLLSENGLIIKIEDLDGAMHFDHNTQHHYHFICTKCKKVYDVDNDLLPKIKEEALANIGLQLTGYNISLKGICYDCQQKH